jgi:hypothetical protein
MPHTSGETVKLTVRPPEPIYTQLEGWTRSLMDESPEDFLELFVNTLMTDQGLRERIAKTYFGGA